MTKDDRITAIPLGVGKDAADDICFTATNPLLVNSSDRVNWVYANWQLNTLERSDLMMALDHQRPPWATIVLEPKSYLEYLSDLSKHSFAMCPRGNGVDCYRVLECLYCGCVPIVKDEIAYDYLEDLPHVKVDNWEQINIDFLKEEQKRINKTSFNMDKIKLEFWKNKIEESRGLLL